MAVVIKPDLADDVVCIPNILSAMKLQKVNRPRKALDRTDLMTIRVIEDRAAVPVQDDCLRHEPGRRQVWGRLDVDARWQIARLAPAVGQYLVADTVGLL